MRGSEKAQYANASVDANLWVDPLRDEESDDAIPQVLMEETVTFTAGQALRRAALNLLWMPTVLGALIGGVGLVMSVGFALAGILPKLPVIVQIGFLPMMLFAGAWVMGFVVSIPIALLSCLPTKHRRIWIEDGTLKQKTSCRTTELPLDQSCWQITERASDIGGRYFGYGSLVVIACDQQAIVCGFSEARRQEWAEALTKAGVKPVVPVERYKAWMHSFMISMLAGALGAALGFVLWKFSNNQFWIASSTIIGFLDGAILSLGLFYWARQGEQETYSKFGPTGCALMFLLTGMKFSAGLEEKLIAGLVNAGVGWFCGRYITARARRLHPKNRLEFGDK